MQTRWISTAASPFDAILDALGASADGMPDFSRTLVVVPGRLWLRMLKEALVLRYPRGVCPPRILTPGNALHFGAETLTGAADREQLEVWAKVLATHGHSPELRTLFPKHRSAAGEQEFRSMAEGFAVLRQELVQNGMTITQAAQRLAEDERWTALAQLETWFTAALSNLGLQDPFQVNEQCAARTAELAEKFTHLIVAFLPDLPKLLEQKLTPLQERITLLVRGRESDAANFDGWGRPNAAWRECRLPAAANHLHTVEDPKQAALLVLELATQRGTQPFDPARSAIALGRSSFFPAFEAVFSRIHYAGEEKNAVLYSPEGVPGTQLRIAGFLQKLRNVLAEPEDFESFNVLMRDAAFLGFLRNGCDVSENQFLQTLDDFVLEALPDRTMPAIHWMEKRDPVLAEIFRKGMESIQRLSRSNDFCTELKKLLKAVFSRPGYPPVRAISFDDEVRYWQQALEALQNSPVRSLLDSAASQCRYLLEECAQERFYPGRDDEAILIYNFLELPALPQSQLFLVGMNWGITPAVRGTTPYLTDGIRKKLGLPNAESLEALESCQLCTLLQGKPDTHLLVLKMDETNSPLRPTGMLFNGCPESELLERADCCRHAERARFGIGNSQDNAQFRLNPESIRQQKFFQNDPLELSVTAFKTYLTSPRLFLLQNVLGIECPDYGCRELAAGDFGTACHRGLEALLNADCTTEEEYWQSMTAGSDRYLTEKCGSPLPLLVSLQQQQIHARLKAAARWLFGHHGQYQLLEAEYPLNGGQGILFGGALIKGTIDRIELWADGTLHLADVKTYSTARTPDKDHLKGRTAPKTLINLQLPLYERLLKRDHEFWVRHQLDPAEIRIEAGYLLLTADSEEMQWSPWSGELAGMCDEAGNVVRRVTGELTHFRDTGELPPEPDAVNYYDLAPLLLPNGEEAMSMEAAR